MIPVARLTPEIIQDFERYLIGRGCYSPLTVRSKVSNARSLHVTTFDIGLPLDESAAIDAIRETHGPGRRRRALNTTARDLLYYFKTREVRT